MKLVISPAKSLNWEQELPTSKATDSLFLDQAEELNKALRKQTPSDLGKLMKISENLSELNYKRNQEWELPFTANNARPAIYAFNGDVYKGLNAYTLQEDKLDVMQDTVRILSGLYGVLKPLDLIQPYRLEMGTKFPIKDSKNLYEFWKKTITESLNNELSDNEVFVNLASNEYFKAVDKKTLKVPIIDVDFKEFKNGVYKTIGIYAKEARGAMARYIIDNNANTVEDLKTFNIGGYGLSNEFTEENKLVFTR